MTHKSINDIRQAIMNDPENKAYTIKGWKPLFTGNHNSKIMIVGQAPGLKAQTTGITWNDISGDNLRKWLGVDKATFYNEDIFALIPMDFYFPGKGKSGDLPPRKGFAEQWHPELLKLLPNIRLIILVGSYAHKYYLKDSQKKNLTETVRSYQAYLPRIFPAIHPSPRNIRWHIKNPWFMDEVIPHLQKMIKIITSSD